jgi:hypothetical protein
LENELNKKNTYMQLFKGDEVLKKDKESEKETIYIYD